MKKLILLPLPLLLAACAASGPVSAVAPPPSIYEFERVEVPGGWPAMQMWCAHGIRWGYAYSRTGNSAQNGIALTLTSQIDPTCPQGK